MKGGGENSAGNCGGGGRVVLIPMSSGNCGTEKGSADTNIIRELWRRGEGEESADTNVISRDKSPKNEYL